MADETGDLHIRRSELMTLGALADPEMSLDSIDLDDLERLRALGLVEGTRPTGIGVPIAATVRSPLVQLRLDFLDPSRRVVCPGWADQHYAVVAVPQPQGVDELKLAPTAFLPARLAEFMGFGPRPVNSSLWQGQRSAFEGLLVARGVDSLLGAIEWRYWKLTMAWAGGGRSLEVVDGGDAGVWLVCDDAESTTMAVVPVSTTEIWVALISTLPTYDEIGHLIVGAT